MNVGIKVEVSMDLNVQLGLKVQAFNMGQNTWPHVRVKTQMAWLCSCAGRRFSVTLSFLKRHIGALKVTHRASFVWDSEATPGTCSTPLNGMCFVDFFQCAVLCKMKKGTFFPFLVKKCF